jgi:hypothetical protein
LRYGLPALVFLAALALGAQARADEDGWTPSDSTIAKMEKVIAVPDPSGNTRTAYQYRRFYDGVIVDGRRKIRGELVAPQGRERPAVFMRPEKLWPHILNRGCDVVNLLYDVQDNRLDWLGCNSEG